MGDFQNEKVGAEQDDLQNRDAQSTATEFPATREVRTLLEGGSRDAAAIAQILHDHPRARTEILALLHRTVGNGFVASVMRENELILRANADGGRPRHQFSPDELRNIADGDGSALDKKPATDPAKARAAADEMNASDQELGAGDKTPAAGLTNAQTTANMMEVDAMDATPLVYGKGNSNESKVATDATVINASSEVKQPEIVKKTEVLKDPAGEQKAAPEADKDDGAENEATGGSKPAVGPVRVTASVLRVRSSPNIARDNIVGRLMRNQVVEAVGHQGEWVEINYRGQTAFIHQSFVVSAQEAPAAKTQDAPAPATAP